MGVLPIDQIFLKLACYSNTIELTEYTYEK